MQCMLGNIDREMGSIVSIQNKFTVMSDCLYPGLQCRVREQKLALIDKREQNRIFSDGNLRCQMHWPSGPLCKHMQSL